MTSESWDLMVDNENNSANEYEFDNILSPVTTNTNAFIMPKLNHDNNNNNNVDTVITNVKYNLFDRFSYIQLTDYIWNNKKILINDKHKRGDLFNWFINLIDLNIIKCKEFIDQNKNSLKKLKNKRQLLLFLNKNFSSIHKINSISNTNSISSSVLNSRLSLYKSSLKNSKNGTNSTSLLTIILKIIFYLFFSWITIFYLVFYTEILDYLFVNDKQKMYALKLLRHVVRSLID
ncbi:hypothetical protein DAPK24_018370 [Pichia kluyveri]|uniref:Autophagy-related protein 9 n=1 Tax=Pichia kluyveri TaxID=36015 RepID=A0AAV5R2P4_PICKL|nr:hypothetical protein DAPK24_018370 [Pichia kluyveri]